MTATPPTAPPAPANPPLTDELAILAAEMGVTRAEASRMLAEAVIAVALNRAAEPAPDAKVAA